MRCYGTLGTRQIKLSSYEHLNIFLSNLLMLLDNNPVATGLKILKDSPTSCPDGIENSISFFHLLPQKLPAAFS